MTLQPGAASDVARILRALCAGSASRHDTDRLIAVASAIVKRRIVTE